MREIKFRAWHKEIEKMFSVLKIDFVDEWVTMWSKIAGQSYDWIDNLVLLQYTGLKDSYGEEIFEGDIVEITLTRTQETRRGEVIYYDGNACYLVKTTMEDYFSFMSADICKIEVLSNIYEKKELLDE